MNSTIKKLLVPAACLALALLAIAVRVAFVLKGNIAFTSDESGVGFYVKTSMTGDSADFSIPNIISGVRFWIGCLFYILCNGWIYSACLASIFMTALFSAVWVLWLRRKVSLPAALVMLLFLALPAASFAYYSTHLERRLETLLAGSIFVFYAGNWFRNKWSLFLLFAISGWVMWSEPFILFFLLPVLVYEFIKKEKPGFVDGADVGVILAGSIAGLSSGYFWGRGVLPENHLHWGIASWSGIQHNLSILTQVFPQFWNGNFSYGYLQYSELGQYLDPILGGSFSIFLSIWTLFTFGIAVWGFWRLSQLSSIHGFWLTCLSAGPALLYILFFIFSAQIWDAMSLRYLAYLTIFIAMGLGLAFHFLFATRQKAAILLLFLIALVQGGLIVNRYERQPQANAFQIILNELRARGFTAGIANYWVAEGVRYLSNDQMKLVEYKNSYSLRDLKQVDEEKRTAWVILNGLDHPENVVPEITEYEKAGHRLGKRWDMPGHWTILEFLKTKR